MRTKLLAVLAMAGLVLFSGCGEHGSGDENPLRINRSGFNALFNPAEGQIPFPNNLLFSGSQDATLNIPVADGEDISDPQVALNALDGFSTIAPISTSFGGAIDPASLNPASVRVFEVTLDTSVLPVAGPVSRIVGELVFGVDFLPTVSSVDPDAATLVILPLKPLKPSSHYLVALTADIKRGDGLSAGADFVYVLAKSSNPLIDAGGASQVPSLSDAQAQALEPVRQLVNAQEVALTSVGVATADVVLSWTFSTQSVGAVLETVRSAVQAAAPPASTLADSSVDSPLGAADVFVGTLDIPYYLTPAASANDPVPLSTFWAAANPAFVGDTERNLTVFNPLPEATGVQTIPLMASIPKGPLPAAGWPVVIYQHGITTNRTTLLAVADALAGAGFAAVAIDLPLHGLTGDETNGTAVFKNPLGALERTFDLDLVNNLTRLPGPDGAIDASGTHFINLASLLTSRDNLRQGVADLFALHRALEDMDLDGLEGGDFDTGNVYLAGHSLGAMVGGIFLALEPSVKAATMGMPGGGLAKLLDGSTSFGPLIEAGLAANGVLKGTADYESFLGAAQTVVDSGDPLNYTAGTVAGRGVLMFEVIGDATVPNNVLADAPDGTVPAPLAGTGPLAEVMGLSQVDSTTSGSQLKALVRFTSGGHASLLDPSVDPAVTTEMQTQMANFFASDRDSGVTVVQIENTDVVEPVSSIAAE